MDYIGSRSFRSASGVAGKLQGALLSLVGIVSMAAGTALAQPATFVDAGAFEAPSSPPSAQEYVGDTDRAFDPSGGETVTVKWIRFELTAPISGELFFDIDTRITSTEPDPSTKDPLIALYDNLGNLIASDDTDGSFPPGIAAGLSFGSTAFRNPPDTPALQGQDGPTLAAGTYWLAVVAGPANLATIGATNWNVTTTGSFPVSFSPFDLFDLSFSVGNTTPLPPPSNDQCSSPLVLTESVGSEPAWEGSNAGALNDASTPCYPFAEPALQPKDIWFSFTPTSTGKVYIEATGGAGGAATPILTQYSACNGSVLRCAGGGSIVFDDSVFFILDAVQGQEILFSLGIFAGGTGDMGLIVRMIPAACPLTIPAGAIAESEACGSDNNGGCNSAPPAFETISLGQTLSGTFFSTGQLRDKDWFEFTISERRNVGLVLRSQLPAAAIVQSLRDGDCSGTTEFFVDNGFYFDDLCAPVTINRGLDAGTYRIIVLPSSFDGWACDSGRNMWVLETVSGDCAGATFSTQPADQTICGGPNTLTFTANASSEGALSWAWEFGRDNGEGGFFWRRLEDGELIFQVATIGNVSGTNTSTVTFSNFLTGSGFAVRAVAIACGEFVSRTAVVTVGLPGDPNCGSGPTCDDIDFNNNEVFPENQDVIDFFAVLAGADCPECNDIDFNNNDVFPEDQDVIDFFNVLAGGECPQ
ncbi:hypothetical protein LBMAG48_04340 [Phycisphaerae bacterium]|nr:hypothetical protein LBMAG48_04340 [Phycisphaerae bacterium]